MGPGPADEWGGRLLTTVDPSRPPGARSGNRGDWPIRQRFQLNRLVPDSPADIVVPARARARRPPGGAQPDDPRGPRAPGHRGRSPGRGRLAAGRDQSPRSGSARRRLGLVAAPGRLGPAPDLRGVRRTAARRRSGSTAAPWAEVDELVAASPGGRAVPGTPADATAGRPGCPWRRSAATPTRSPSTYAAGCATRTATATPQPTARATRPDSVPRGAGLVACARCREASPSPVYGARLLSGLRFIPLAGSNPAASASSRRASSQTTTGPVAYGRIPCSGGCHARALQECALQVSEPPLPRVLPGPPRQWGTGEQHPTGRRWNS